MPLLGATGGGSAKGFGALANLGYFIKNSLRFRSSASAYLQRTPASTTNRQKFTWSAWIKLGSSTTNVTFFSSGVASAARFQIGTASNAFAVSYNNGSSWILDVSTDAVFRDPAAWYHVVIALDTTQATEANRVKVYVNNTSQSYTGTNVPQNTNTTVNEASIVNNIARLGNGTGYFDGYMAEVNFVDGQQLTPSSFGKTDTGTGQWVPKKFAGTYGTNGFYLKFADASAATAAAIGKDSSPNGNNWTPNNISVTAGVTYDAMIDSPTLSAAASNYAVLNPLGGQGGTWSNGNLQYTGPTAWKNTLSTIMLPSTGKFYAEATLLGTGFADNDSYAAFGVGTTLGTVPSSNNCSIGDGGDLNNFGTYTTGSGKLSTGNIVSLSIDRDANTFNYRVNNTTRFSGTIGTTAGADLFFNYWSYSGSYGQMAVNFGQRPFAYTPPAGFKSLNAFNLP